MLTMKTLCAALVSWPQPLGDGAEHYNTPTISMAGTPSFCPSGMRTGQSMGMGRISMQISVSEFMRALKSHIFRSSMHVALVMVLSQNAAMGLQANRNWKDTMRL